MRENVLSWLKEALKLDANQFCGKELGTQFGTMFVLLKILFTEESQTRPTAIEPVVSKPIPVQEPVEEPVKVTWLEARSQMKKNLDIIYPTYKRLVFKFGDLQSRKFLDPKYVSNGDILADMRSLFNYLKDRELKRVEDTYECCLYCIGGPGILHSMTHIK